VSTHKGKVLEQNTVFWSKGTEVVLLDNTLISLSSIILIYTALLLLVGK